MHTTIDKVASECVAVRLRMLNRVVTNIYDDALRPLGLKVSQLNILVVTAKLGVARPAQMCEILRLDASTLSRNVERMRAHGWLEVVPGDAQLGRHDQYVQLTHLQAQRPQGVVVEVRDRPVQEAQAHGDARPGDGVDAARRLGHDRSAP